MCNHQQTLGLTLLFPKKPGKKKRKEKKSVLYHFLESLTCEAVLSSGFTKCWVIFSNVLRFTMVYVYIEVNKTFQYKRAL